MGMRPAACDVLGSNAAPALRNQLCFLFPRNSVEVFFLNEVSSFLRQTFDCLRY